MNSQNIWCVGRNYADHALELNNPLPQKPLIFLKSGSCVNLNEKIILPQWTDDIHHECELAVLLSAHGQPKALTLGLDLTARSVQSESKKKGEPWTLAKSFKGACPLGDWQSFPKDFSSLNFTLQKNGAVVQKGFAKDMIFSLEKLIAYLMEHFPLQENDVLLTGTPSGVGPLCAGDLLEGEIPGIIKTRWLVE